MTVNTQELRELVEKATPGPWEVVAREVMEDASVYPTHIVGGAAGFQVCLMESPNLAKLAMDDPNGWPASGKACEANTAYIAAANPLAVSALLDELDALRAQLQARQWMPIETAPKDSTVWAYNGEQGRMRWIEGEGYALWAWEDELLSDVDPMPIQPTSWMPLPPAPPQGDGA